MGVDVFTSTVTDNSHREEEEEEEEEDIFLVEAGRSLMNNDSG